MAWQVLLADRLSYIRLLILVQGVIAPHDPLQVRKLVDHASQQVGLGQCGGALCHCRVGTGQPGDVDAQVAHPEHAIMHAAKLVVKHNGFELLDMVVERHLAVTVPVKARVREAGIEHTFVTVDDIGRIAALDVGDEYEARLHTAAVVDYREILLVSLHGADQCLGRDFQVIGIEPALQGNGPFHQRRDLVEQVAVDDCLAALFSTKGRDLLPHPFAAQLVIGDDMARVFECVRIVGRLIDLQAARCMKTVATRRVRCIDAQQASRYYVVAMQHDQPVHGPHEF